MTSSLINRRDLDFLLYEFLKVDDLTARPRFAEHDRDVFNAVIDTAHSIASDVFAPHNAKADANEPTFDGEKVSMIPEVADALKTYIDAGFMGAQHDYELGGMQLPTTITMTVSALFNAANVGTAGYPFLTIGAANVLRTFGSEDQKKRFMQPMIDGRFFGTMCLSEPQAGSSLSDIRTKAVQQTDGSYRLTGNKMWISGGDHELSENIVHLVLAKIPGGPAGVKGISLFIVPKYLVNDDGSVGKRNDVRLAGLNHKMGYRGTTNTLLNFGEKDGAVGYLIGEEHQGLFYMFQMMNEARIGVGLAAVSLGYAGYLYSLNYARNRPQGRHPDGKNTGEDQVMLIEHADIRRLLLAQKAAVEGGLALCLYASRLVDDEKTAADEKSRKEAALLLDILTPVVKAWPSEYCLEANKHAIQVLGGYGYTRDYPVEQYYRDNRLNPIHEGTNGIQALDLLGRKIIADNGAAMKLLARHISETIKQARGMEALSEFAGRLEKAVAIVGNSSIDLTVAMAKGKTRLALANASYYLDMFGHTVIAWIWLRQAIEAQSALARHCTPADRAFYQGKIRTCQYFFRYELVKIGAWSRILSTLDDTTFNMKDEQF